jgi:hypothetical protein
MAPLALDLLLAPLLPLAFSHWGKVTLLLFLLILLSPWSVLLLCSTQATSVSTVTLLVAVQPPVQSSRSCFSTRAVLSVYSAYCLQFKNVPNILARLLLKPAPILDVSINLLTLSLLWTQIPMICPSRQIPHPQSQIRLLIRIPSLWIPLMSPLTKPWIFVKPAVG